jgi:hypothetical protein
VEDGNWTRAGRDHGAISEADPLALVLIDQLIADSTVRRFVLAPVRINLLRNFGGQFVSQACHRSSRERR